MDKIRIMLWLCCTAVVAQGAYTMYQSLDTLMSSRTATIDEVLK